MAASKLDGFIARYGPIAGPKLYHALQSRAAYIGSNARRRRTIARLTGLPNPSRSPDRAGKVNAESTPLLAGIEPGS